ncbi:hypothetical protein IV203_029389 [Nitzschia inconspicua]|uniref:Uncharacterized protein n=1 Tax=Nitzschia inconspicua TaxID=303405 RepID=A0A9K3Q395_9STRA|nr:hypothetical protein IV203_029389 [Nitzschia inconspicua]
MVRGLAAANMLDHSNLSSTLQWDDSAWTPRKRKLEKIHENKSNSLAMIDTVASPAKRYRLMAASPSILKHIERCSFPPINSKAGEICKRLRNAMKHGVAERRLFFDISNQPAASATPREAACSPFILYRFLRVRMAAGLLRSSFSMMHQLLRNGYDEATEYLEKMDRCASAGTFMNELLMVRDRLASLWCVYAHFIMEVGKLGIVPKKKPQLRQKTATVGVTYQEIAAFAISVLWHARDCALVGNQGAVTLCLGRLLVSSPAITETKVENNYTELKRSLVLEKIRMAILTCWDSVDWTRADQLVLQGLSMRKSAMEQVTEHLSLVDFPGLKVHQEKSANPQILQDDFESILMLPHFLRDNLKVLKNSSFIFDDRNSTRTLCLELNRWSSLKVQLERDRETTVALSLSRNEGKVPCMVEEQLPLFKAIDLSKASMDLYTSDPEDDALLLWKW